eukprot:s47_g41.t1
MSRGVVNFCGKMRLTFAPPDGDGPVHPDTHGGVLPEEPDDNMHALPDQPLDDDNQPANPTGQDPDDGDPNEEYFIPDDYGPPLEDDLGIREHSGETHDQWFPS